MRSFRGAVTCLVALAGIGCEQQAGPATPSAKPETVASSTTVEASETEVPEPAAKAWRGLLGEGNDKIRRDGAETKVWAGGADPGEPGADYFDFTGAPIEPENLQFGIGKHRIPAIDNPLFVKPDDPRLMTLRVSPYRPEERPQSADDIMVIGYAHGDDVRAYPTALLDGHELVNDVVGGKPVTVGW